MNRGPDRDDWFEGTEAADTQENEQIAAEDWLQDVPAPTQPWHEKVDRRVVVGAVVGIVLLVAVLAAFGVFSSGNSPPPEPAITTTPALTTPSVPAQTVPATTTVSSTATGKLKLGDSGAQVRQLQQDLVKLGFPAATVDGRFGPGTEAAVKAFQTANGLPADGIVGDVTRRAIAAALRRT